MTINFIFSFKVFDSINFFNNSIDIRFCSFLNIYSLSTFGALSINNINSSFFGYGLLFYNCTTKIIVGYRCGGLYFYGKESDLHFSCFLNCISFYNNAFGIVSNDILKSSMIFIDSCRPLSRSGPGDDGTFEVDSQNLQLSNFNVTNNNNNEDGPSGVYVCLNNGYLSYSNFYNNVGRGSFLILSYNNYFILNKINCIKCQSTGSDIGFLRLIGKNLSTKFLYNNFINLSFNSFIGSLSTSSPIFENCIFNFNISIKAILINNEFNSSNYISLNLNLLNQFNCNFTFFNYFNKKNNLLKINNLVIFLFI